MSRPNLARFVEAYFRHRWLNLIPLLIMILAAAAWLVVTKVQYTAHGTMYIQRGTLLATLTAVGTDNTQSTWATPADATAGEVRSLIQTDAFLRAIIAKSDLEPEMSKGPRSVDQTLTKVRQSVWMQSLGPNIVLFGAAYTSPVVAQQLSAGIMDNYIQWRANTDLNEGVSAQAYFQKLIPPYQADLDTARQDLQAYL